VTIFLAKLAENQTIWIKFVDAIAFNPTAEKINVDVGS
jgi:hypothetical protein